MKKTIEFKTEAGNTYKLTRPTLDERAELLAGITFGEAKDPDSVDVGYIFKQNAKACKMCLPKPSDAEKLTNEEVYEIGARANELASLGK